MSDSLIQGSAYPNATADGINDEHEYGIEETSNMLIMTLAYSQRSGNGTFLSTHVSVLRQVLSQIEEFNDYLVVYPASQMDRLLSEQYLAPDKPVSHIPSFLT